MKVYRVEDGQGNDVALPNERALIEHIGEVLLYSLPGDTIAIYVERMAKEEFEALPEFEGMP